MSKKKTLTPDEALEQFKKTYKPPFHYDATEEAFFDKNGRRIFDAYLSVRSMDEPYGLPLFVLLAELLNQWYAKDESDKELIAYLRKT